ncbi:HmuY family protein [Xanthomarina sp. F1114]|uniref:HmuY family protein n=1 Tax=Xanthomarina sp. F1114 TaxID=2996019 RepID=UPI00225DDF64|nr:HmuY family protein [Xanthomarina sp. F1114]MCX7546470.1 HmuY family protein [Xanthomarina sp. F1114]
MTNKFSSLLCGVLLISSFGCSSDDNNEPSGPIDVIIEGAQVTPEVGGPNQQNQVYIDLSTNTSTTVQRDTWDLGFYSGSEFRVAINGSIYMATAKLTENNIDAVNSSSPEVQDLQTRVAVGTFAAETANFIDAPSGNINGTAIEAISNTDSQNNVYLLNLGYKVGTTTPANGAVAVNGDPRGWMKIRVLKNGNDYVLQYADLDTSTHQEVTITKSSDFNFNFFSFNTESEVSVEPVKSQWDLNFTVFTNEIEGYGAYGYSDFVTHNTKGGAAVYSLNTEDTSYTYENFTLADVDNSNFVFNDQRTIGGTWRNGGGPSSLPSLKDNMFYVLQDTDGNLYKLQFLALTNAEGVRGYPEFVYSLLE